MSFFSELHAASRTAVDSHPIIHQNFGIPVILEPDQMFERWVPNNLTPAQVNEFLQIDDEARSRGLDEYIDGGNEAGDFQEPSPEEDNDDYCVCSVHRSEHKLCGCGEGFQSPKDWARECEMIRGMSEDEYERAYHPEDAWF